tara:strand:+ start:3778 stop:4701 length:924 start_codon:yes stop_codon:yes gene_type:complete
MNEFFELFAKFTDEFMALLFFLMLSFCSAIMFYFYYFKKNISSRIQSLPEKILNNQNPSSSAPKSFDQLAKEEQLQREIVILKEELANYKYRSEVASGELDDSPGEELEAENILLKKELEVLNHRITEFKKTSSDLESNQKLIEENEELELRLREYEIIEKDLANLRQIQDENTRLKELIRGKDLEASFLENEPEEIGESDDSSTDFSDEKVEDKDNPVVSDEKNIHTEKFEDESVVKSDLTDIPSSEENLENDTSDKSTLDEREGSKIEAKEDSNEDELGEVVEIEKDGKEKSADELLSEFEKMLG